MIEYSTWKNCLLTSSLLCTLVSENFFQVQYQIIKPIKNHSHWAKVEAKWKFFDVWNGFFDPFR